MKKNKSGKSVKSICVIGAWHLGCIVSACLADMRNKVNVVDFDKNTIKNLQSGNPPLFEPGLEKLIKKNLKLKRLNYFMNFQEALKNADLIFITFDTPVNDKDKSDLRPIFNACNMIAKYSSNKKPYIVISSQIPVGTSRILKKYISRKNPELSPCILYNPENLRLGRAINTFMKPDRIVIGEEKKGDAKKLLHLYKKIKSPKLVMNLKSAEMVKHALNSFLAVSVSFINEIANLCELTGANINNVVTALKSDRRIGSEAFLNPGLGFAGGTLARDLQVLLSTGRKHHVKTQMIKAAIDVNKRRTRDVLRKIKREFPKLKGLKGALLGLTYKPGTSTLRRSISLMLASEMSKSGIKIRAYDPKVSKWDGKSSYKRFIKLCKDPYDAAKTADFLILATEWPEFKSLNFGRIERLMSTGSTNGRCPVLVDTKNILNPEKIIKKGFNYIGTGVSFKRDEA